MNIKKEVIIELCLLLWKYSLNSSLQYFLELIEMNAKIADQAPNGDSKQERWVINFNSNNKCGQRNDDDQTISSNKEFSPLKCSLLGCQ